jgi:hypothetical protein
MTYTFRLLNPRSGSIVAAVSVRARFREEAAAMGRPALAAFRPSRSFWDTVEPPAGVRP